MNFLKNNWFKIAVILLLLFYCLININIFLTGGASNLFKCNKLTGECRIVKTILRF
jgi:hypothetical protein